MSRARSTVLLVALAVSTAVLWPAGRLWILLGVLMFAAAAARRAWARGSRLPAVGLGAMGLSLIVVGFVEAKVRRGGERLIRGLYESRPDTSDSLRGPNRATVEGPTGPLSVVVVFAGDELAAISFTHSEPPWIGDRPLNALANAVVEAGHLVSPRAGVLEAPIERAGLRALEVALIPEAARDPFPPLTAWLFRGEQDRTTLSTLPAVLLLIALAWAGLCAIQPERDPEPEATA